ncbi:MAG: DUF4032 domain-containing protein, partial [Acidimicrobiia bacterium]
SGKSVGVFKWLTNSFEPLVEQIRELKEGDPVQGYCDFLAHRFRLARENERDVENDEAFQDWVASGMPGFDLSADQSSVAEALVSE